MTMMSSSPIILIIDIVTPGITAHGLCHGKEEGGDDNVSVLGSDL